ncbi:uncharacterized protein K460DRAFT_419389 [Cucurbitaria berberidis CBS 394.84]|uniref:Uncharacterized protein n=1 Tax=Cucurbitaria berberidis CBS 394.84 TaxID=1168544 RepID=A0A9P4G8Y3_9PLEO|nr:uncharacterized protein K460DRAFT_419389 [Cucurbitaria berberidis CBS 394.84]KAF1841303.1 hypothetical protein K460DRAFT_419389 [Cucurbitaria berberidis CBS 394.84]
MCYPTLLEVLKNLSELRKSEFSGASGVLSLLPTIGALLGAPTNEVWTLLTILPFGGSLAMLLSFGGAIMPVRVEDYEIAIKKGNIAIGSIVSFRNTYVEGGVERDSSFTRNLDLLDEKVSARIANAKSLRPGKSLITFGLVAMVLLIISSHAAMAIVEQGGILPWWCVCQWWMHFWYFMVTVSAITENIVQVPFSKQHKLYVSRVPYEITISGGQSILTDLHRTQSEPENVGLALKQLNTIPAAKVSFYGSTQYTQSRNTVLVMVSIVGNSLRWISFWRPLSKLLSIAVFITGTAMFASATLVALPMAVCVLTLVISAGVFSRAIAGWLVRRVSEKEPLIHVIVNDQEEANHAICRILKLKLADDTDVQVEIGGHVFVNGRRITSRSKWYVAIWGVLANPYNLLLVNSNPHAASQPLLANNDSNVGFPLQAVLPR